MIKKTILLLIFISISMINYGAISVTSPSGAETIEAADDFATGAFQDPWDMNEQTDLGWFIWDVVSGSKSNLSNVTFANGVFSAGSSSADPNISILETGIGASGTCNLGKIGTNYKIDATKYKVFAIRLKLASTSGAYEDAVLFWSRNTIYSDMSMSTPGAFHTYPGWGIYIVNIPDMGYSVVGNSGYSWGNEVDSLRFDPCAETADIDIDWIRLVEVDSSLNRTIRWSGNSGNVDIYLDNDKNESNGTLGIVAKSVSGSSYSLYAGALAPGTNYYVGIKNSSGGSLQYSSGYYKVNEIPQLTFTAPSEEGGADFATVELNNAWDMNNTSDLDKYSGLSGAPTISTVSAETMAGDSLGNISVLKGTSEVVSGTVGDPILYPLWFYEGRGETTQIDSDKYRILVLKMGLPGAWDLVAGSVARLYWHVQGEFNGNVEKMNQSADIILRHKSGNVVMNTIIADLKDLPLENSQSNTGWNGSIDGLRLDPHEFPSAYRFYIQDIKLAAYETADESYTFQWDYSDTTATSSTMSLYRDSNDSGFNGTLIASGLDPEDGEYTWDTSNMSSGVYYIYATFSDGYNDNQSYARWPIVIDHTPDPTAVISLSRTGMDFGAVGNYNTSSQTFMIENTGSGDMDWTVSDNASWLNCTPTSGSGSGIVTVSVNGSGLNDDTYTGTISVSSTNATNSPQTLTVTMVVYDNGQTSSPFGEILTPTNNSSTSSSIPVTGWALDDIGIESVKIYNGDSYVGDAIFVEGARPDLESANPGYPQNYQAGWGYMLLSYFLPGGGNGSYTLVAKATDKEGNIVTLGSKTVNINNDDAVNPFGAIDTPTQGGSASGSNFNNIGWALTAQPNKIPEDGSTINVYVSSTNLGNVTYNQPRPDIASLFPGYANSDAAMGTFSINTTAYANGIYTIAWAATDDAGNVDGIGSRFFTVQNTGSIHQSTTRGYTNSQKNNRFIPGGNMDVQLAGFSPDLSRSVGVIKGYRQDITPVETLPNDKGELTITIKELERMEIHFSQKTSDILKEPSSNSSAVPGFAGYLAVGKQLRPLPIGSTLDVKKGTFSWLPAPGFSGEYKLIFIDKKNHSFLRINIHITPAAK